MSQYINSDYYKKHTSPSAAESLAEYANSAFEQLGIDERINIDTDSASISDGSGDTPFNHRSLSEGLF